METSCPIIVETIPRYVPAADIPYPDPTSLPVYESTVNTVFVEKQQRLLVEPLYGSWVPADGRPFRALCNVGLFHAYKVPPHVPDAMLALGVPPTDGIMKPDNRSYFLWIVGKPPDIVILIASQDSKKEMLSKLEHYFSIGVRYCAVFDPIQSSTQNSLRVFAKHYSTYQSIVPAKINSTGLGLMLWDGEYENERATWLRWCTSDGNLIPTTKERAEREASRASEAERLLAEERKRIESLLAQLSDRNASS